MKRLILFMLMLIFVSSFVWGSSPADLNNDLVFYYSFNTDDSTGTTLNDLSGNGHNVVCYGMGTECNFISGLIDKGVGLDGINDYINMESFRFSDTYNSFTYSTWFYGDELPSALKRLMIFRESSSENDIMQIYTSNNKLTIEIRINGVFKSRDTSTLDLNEWYHLAVVYNSTHILYYVNGESLTSNTLTGGFYLDSSHEAEMGAYNGATFFEGGFDETGFWKRALNEEEILFLFNNGDGLAYTQWADFNTLLFTSKNIFNNTSIKNFTLNFLDSGLNNISLSSNTTTGTLVLNTTPYNLSYDYDIYFLSDNMKTFILSDFNITPPKEILINFTPDDTTPPTIYSNLQGNNTNATGNINLYFNVTDATLSNITISGCNLSHTVNEKQLTGEYIYNITIGLSGCAIGSQTINVTATDFLNNTRREFFQYEHLGAYTIQAQDESETAINTFNISINGAHYGGTTNGSVYIPNLSAGSSIIITMDAQGYAYQNQTINITQPHATYTFSLNKQNSVTINIYDQATGARINSKLVNLTFEWDGGQFLNSTETGYLYLTNLTPRNYTVFFTAPFYIVAHYDITIGARSWQELNAYLLPSGSTDSNTVFTLQEYDSSETIEAATVLVQRRVAGVWTTVQVKMTDITGRTTIYYEQNTEYKFTITKDEYITREFTLYPINYASYLVRLNKDTDPIESIYKNVFASFSGIFENNKNNPVTFSTASPFGEFSEYGFTISYQNQTKQASGTNAYGAVFNDTLLIENADLFDVVTVYYYYELSDGTTQQINATYSIIGGADSSGTIMQLRGKNYGFGLFEIVIIVLFVTLFLGGAGAFFMGETGAAIGILLGFGYFAYTQFIPIWAVIISIIMVIVVLFKTGGGR